MTKSKRALIIATIIVFIGVTGAVFTGIYSISIIKNQVESNMISISSREKEIAKFNDNIEKICMDFNYQNYSVLVRESKDEFLHIKTDKDFEDNIEIDRNWSTKTKNLSLKTHYESPTIDVGSIKEGIAPIITTGLISSLNLNKKLILEVPRPVDIDFVNLGNSMDSEFIVSDGSVLKDSFSSKSSIAKIKLPYFNSLKSIYIDLNNEVNLDMREFVNANKVVLKGTKVNLYSEGKLSDYDANKIPEKVDIFAKDLESNSFIPLGKKVDIKVDNFIDLIMPFDKYNISGKIESNKEDPVKLDNLKFSIDKGGYKGRYSLANGEVYEMNINTSSGKLTNANFDNVKYASSEDSYVDPNVLRCQKLNDVKFIQEFYNGIKDIIWTSN